MKRKQHHSLQVWRKRRESADAGPVRRLPWDRVKTAWIALLLGMNLLLLAVLGVVHG